MTSTSHDITYLHIQCCVIQFTDCDDFIVPVNKTGATLGLERVKKKTGARLHPPAPDVAVNSGLYDGHVLAPRTAPLIHPGAPRGYKRAVRGFICKYSLVGITKTLSLSSIYILVQRGLT